MRKKWMYFAPLAIIAMFAFIAIGGQVVHLLWNWLLPAIFGWKQITFWQALGLLALCRILFGGFGFHGRNHGMRRRMHERWEKMTPEERERFRGGMRSHWDCEPPPAGNDGATLS